MQKGRCSASGRFLCLGPVELGCGFGLALYPDRGEWCEILFRCTEERPAKQKMTNGDICAILSKNHRQVREEVCSLKENFPFEMILDNISDGIFLTDRDGTILYANSVYMKLLNMSKDDMIGFNVHRFLELGQVEFCISDIVCKENRQIIMFQDVYDTSRTRQKMHRQLAIFTPLFGPDGEIENILAVVKPLNRLNSEYYAASQNNIISSIAVVPDNAQDKDQGFLIAESRAMQGILKVVHEVADTEASVLISGESGTGKEVIAHYIHDCSSRRDHPLVIINCASLPENLLEAELFGYEKGAFTGSAPNGKPGLFEEAAGGTLFLDEINSMPLSLQGKLLRAIETKSIQRIGATKGRRIDFRLLVATNENLEQLVREQRFRADLFYRINVIPIVIPPLRERREDIVPLALKFLEMYCKKNQKEKVFSPRTLENIRKADWPGNVRELKNFVERSVLMSRDTTIEVTDISSISSAGGQEVSARRFGDQLCFTPTAQRYEALVRKGVSLDEYLARCEAGYLEWAFQEYGSTYKVAEALHTSQASIMRRKKKYFSSSTDSAEEK